MNGSRQFWIAVVFIVFVLVGQQIWGPAFTALALVVAATVGLLGNLLYSRWKRRLARHLVAHDPDVQDDILMKLRNVPFRPELAEAVGREQGRSPLRSIAEEFEYPPFWSRAGRWLMWTCWGFAGLLTVGWTMELARGRAGNTSHLEAAAVIVAFAVGGFLMKWDARERTGTLTITDDDVTWQVPGRATRRLAWDEVTAVRQDDFLGRVVVRSPRTRIVFWYTLKDYGRAINLIVTRAPRRWKDG